MTRWAVLLGGVALGLALVALYIVQTLPPEAREMMRTSYRQGFEAGAAAATKGAPREVRRTPLPATSWN